jgi:hypothetical protein
MLAYRRAVWQTHARSFNDMSDNQNNPPKKPNLQIQLDEPVAQGAYANLSLVNHTETEFVFDFVFVQPMEPRAKVRSRIISSPKHAKRFLAALQDNLARYEERFGEINVTQQQGGPVH